MIKPAVHLGEKHVYSFTTSHSIPTTCTCGSNGVFIDSLAGDAS